MTMDPPVPPGATATWTWRYGDAEGRVLVPAAAAGVDPAPGFTAQADAESWVGEYWRALVAAGVDSVTLEVDGVVVYGPMSLHPAAD